MKIIERIVESVGEPGKYDLWLRTGSKDGQDSAELLANVNNKWITISGSGEGEGEGGGGSDSNVLTINDILPAGIDFGYTAVSDALFTTATYNDIPYVYIFIPEEDIEKKAKLMGINHVPIVDYVQVFNPDDEMNPCYCSFKNYYFSQYEGEGIYNVYGLGTYGIRVVADNLYKAALIGVYDPDEFVDNWSGQGEFYAIPVPDDVISYIGEHGSGWIFSYADLGPI